VNYFTICTTACLWALCRGSWVRPNRHMRGTVSMRSSPIQSFHLSRLFIHPSWSVEVKCMNYESFRTSIFTAISLNREFLQSWDAVLLLSELPSSLVRWRGSSALPFVCRCQQFFLLTKETRIGSDRNGSVFEERYCTNTGSRRTVQFLTLNQFFYWV
jgi:hypothetical protein